MSPKPSSTPPQRKRRATPATAKESQNSANPMWGARFDSGPDRVMEAINASIGFDHRLYAEDITASRAHCEMLVAQQILDSGTGARILKGLDQVLAEIEDGSFTFRIALEDIHLNIHGISSGIIRTRMIQRKGELFLYGFTPHIILAHVLQTVRALTFGVVVIMVVVV